MSYQENRWRYGSKPMEVAALEVARRTKDEEADYMLRKCVKRIEEFKDMNRRLATSLQAERSRNAVRSSAPETLSTPNTPE